MTPSKPQDEPTITLSRDEFTARRRELDGHPEAVTASSRIDVVNHYGDVSTWVLDLYRVEGSVTAFVQRGTRDSYDRLVIPPQVTAAIARHQAGLVSKSRRKLGKRQMADRGPLAAAGFTPEARAKALATRKANAAKRAARRAKRIARKAGGKS